MGDFDDIGALYHTFTFGTDDEKASRAFRKVQKDTRYIATYRWHILGVRGQAITIMGEDEPKSRPQLERARRILLGLGGEEAPTPPQSLVTFRSRRIRSLVENGGLRSRVHYGGGGHIMLPDGTDLGPVRRPQG